MVAFIIRAVENNLVLLLPAILLPNYWMGRFGTVFSSSFEKKFSFLVDREIIMMGIRNAKAHHVQLWWLLQLYPSKGLFHWELWIILRSREILLISGLLLFSFSCILNAFEESPSGNVLIPPVCVLWKGQLFFSIFTTYFRILSLL